MEYRQLGKSDVRVSVVTFGAWAIGGAMWGGADENDAIAAIQASIEAGVTSIDTAPVYGFGKSEELVAKAVAGKRDKVQLLTKFGLRWDEIAEGEPFFDLREKGKTYKIYRNSRKHKIIQECEDSLRRLNTDRIDLYQCHWRDHTTAIEETAEALAQLIKEGKIRAAGVSNFTPEEIAEAEKIVPIASNQPPYSMLQRDIEKKMVPFCIENKVGLIVYSPMERGLLTGKFSPDHRFAADDHRAQYPMFFPENIKLVNEFLGRLRPIAEKHKATIGQLVINWTLRQQGITAALVGARNSEQALENAHAVSFHLSDDELASINRELQQLKLVEPLKAK